MRQSVATSRGGGSGHANTVAVAKLIEKKKEYDALCALERASASYLERIKGLSHDCDLMANAGEGTRHVLYNDRILTA